MNTSHLDVARPEIECIWSSQSPATSFFQKIKLITRFYKAFCKRKAMEYRASELQLRTQLD
jgi:hypothetical protein